MKTLNELLTESIVVADSYGNKIVIRQSNSHGLCYSVTSIDKYTNLSQTSDFWGDTIEEALEVFLNNVPFNGSPVQKTRALS